jgi:5-(carboxyamino)imidazole ribonucleotide synthase
MNARTLGILGGGQLGRMTALAARPLGFAVRVLDPDPQCAARPVVEHVEVGAFDDAAAAARLAQGCVAVTLEIEKIAPAALAAVEAHARLRPRARVVEIVQDRVRQRAWLVEHGFPCGPHRIATAPAELAAALEEFQGDAFVKSAFGGYDGRGQARVGAAAGTGGTGGAGGDADAAWRAAGGGACVVERALDLALEFSILVARDARGASDAYPAARNVHVDGILEASTIPGEVGEALEARARAIAHGIAERLDVVGLLCVEFFVAAGGELYVNELAPRPHNSFHGTIEACVTSQFEQLVRAVTGLPLGSTQVVSPVAIVNLLGDRWAGGQVPAFENALALPGVRLHLYGKGDPRPGRKMGHLSAFGATPDAARERVREAASRL